MQYPQTRYQDSLAVGISDVQLNLTCALTPPTRTQGILTIGRLQSNTEDVFFTNVAGNLVTIGLRGLSQTALTPTTLLANQKVHNANESLEITTHHNYDTDLLRKTENDTVTGTITFTTGPLIPAIKDSNGNISLDLPATASAVNNLKIQNSATLGNVIETTEGSDSNISLELQAKGTGIIILKDGSQLKTSAAPVNAQDIANKKYVDDAASIIPTALYTFGEAVDGTTTPQAVYQKTSDSKIYKTVGTGTESTFKFIGFVTTNVLINTLGRVILEGQVTGFPGATFTTGDDLYIQDATGTVSNSFGTYIYKVARATSPTSLLIEKGPRIVTGSSLFSTTSAGNNDLSIDIGFPANKIRLLYWIQGYSGATGANSYCKMQGELVFRNGTLFMGNLLQAPNFVLSATDNQPIGTLLSDIYNSFASFNLIAGDHLSGTGSIDITLSFPSFSSTGFTVRRATVPGASPNTARANLFWEVEG